MSIIPQYPLLQLGGHHYNAPDVTERYRRQLAEAQMAMGGQTQGDFTSPLRMIVMRLRVPQGERLPFDHISAHVTPEVAVVFLVIKGKPVMIEDDPGLFPSDNLVTQLRVLIGTTS